MRITVTWLLRSRAETTVVVLPFTAVIQARA
jgi:hypothetical protein